MKDIFKGRLVRLAAADAQELGALASAWDRDSEYMRLMDSDPVRLFSAAGIRQFIEKQDARDPMSHRSFALRALTDDALIGHASLAVFNWGARSAWLGIGIGRRELWGKGYGTDAIELMLQFAFTELNLRRVNLSVFDYNRRAIRAYEKAGFRVEGRYRTAYQRDGIRFDELQMGILREDWLERQTASA